MLRLFIGRRLTNALKLATTRLKIGAVSRLNPMRAATTAAHSVRTGTRLMLMVRACARLLTS
jgi:hypothetical protein